MKRWLHVGLGALLALALGATYVAGLLARPAPEPLTVDLDGPGPYQWRIDGAHSPPLRIGPPELLGRLVATGEEDHHGAGLALRTWRLNYGERWVREIAVPVLAGAPAPEGGCDVALSIDLSLLDPARGGDGLVRLARRQLDLVFPLSVRCGLATTVTLPAVAGVELVAEPIEGRLRLGVVATLTDGTQVGGRSEMRLLADRGGLVVERAGPVEATFDGPARQRCEGTLEVQAANVLWRLRGIRESVVMTAARAVIASELQPVLEELNATLARLGEPWAPFPGRPDDRISLQLAASPVIDEHRIGLTLCPRLHLAEPLENAAIAAPPLVPSAPPGLPPEGDGSGVPRARLTVNAAGINRLLHLLWQTGELRRLGSSAAAVDQLPDTVRALAFEVEGFDPRLPPVVLAEHTVPAPADTVQLRLGNVAVGRWGQRTVVAHADLAAGARTEGGRVLIGGTLGPPRIQCVQPHAGGWRLTPCLADLLPAIRDTVEGQQAHFELDAQDLLQSLARGALQGLELGLDDLQVHSTGEPPALHLSVGISVQGVR